MGIGGVLVAAQRRGRSGSPNVPARPYDERRHFKISRITSTSPSLTIYSLPSSRSRPFSRTPGYPPCSIKAFQLTTSARMNFFSKSLWIAPAAFDRGAVHGNGPGADFGFAGGQEAHQAEQRVGRRDQSRQRRFL